MERVHFVWHDAFMAEYMHLIAFGKKMKKKNALFTSSLKKSQQWSSMFGKDLQNGKNRTNIRAETDKTKNK